MPKILLVEDNESNRDLISRYLQHYEYDVTVAEDGVDGLRKARADFENIDLILMDMNLPDLDGWEVTRRLRADATTKMMPIIALTAHAMIGDRQKAIEAGCNDYTTKPIDFNSLFHKIESLTRKATSS